jgi:hypothetical protein
VKTTVKAKKKKKESAYKLHPNFDPKDSIEYMLKTNIAV